MIEPSTLLWINLVAFLCYIPIVCYLDIKYREIEPLYWTPLFFIGICVIIYLTLNGMIPWYSFIISGIMCMIFRFAMQCGYLEGADFLFLCLISAFWVVNPYPHPHGLMQIIFYIYLAFVSAMTAIVVLGYNILNGNEWELIDMMSHYPRGVPYIVPISVAFLMSVVFG